MRIITEKSFCDDISQKINELKKCKLYDDSWILTTGKNIFLNEHDLLCTSSK